MLVFSRRVLFVALWYVALLPVFGAVGMVQTVLACGCAIAPLLLVLAQRYALPAAAGPEPVLPTGEGEHFAGPRHGMPPARERHRAASFRYTTSRKGRTGTCVSKST
jgi:hypothetical protein